MYRSVRILSGWRLVSARRVPPKEFETDVRPLAGQLPERLGVAAAPVEALRACGFGARLMRERSIAPVEIAYEGA